MGLFSLFSENPDFVTSTASTFANAVPILIIIMILIGIVYWIRSLQRVGRTEIRVYRRP